MKKFLIAVVMVLMLANPAVANAPINIIVNDKPLDTPGIVIDNTTYIPLRAVADIFDATTYWESGTIGIKTHTTDIKEITRPPIQGDEEFTGKINAALDLLEEKDFPHYLMVCQNTWDIAPLLIANPAESVKDSLAFNIAGSTRIMPLLINNSRRYTPTCLAGVLVHEAIHMTNEKYKNDEPGSETVAYNHEEMALRQVGAPQWMIDEIILVRKQKTGK